MQKLNSSSNYDILAPADRLKVRKNSEGFRKQIEEMRQKPE